MYVYIHIYICIDVYVYIYIYSVCAFVFKPLEGNAHGPPPRMHAGAAIFSVGCFLFVWVGTVYSDEEEPSPPPRPQGRW